MFRIASIVPILLCVFATLAMATPCVQAKSADPVVKILNSQQVYHPTTVKKGKRYKKPATLKTSTIFDSIKEWKEIKKKGLTTKDAEYHLLLKKANDSFSKALKTVQRKGKYDIMAEDGAISCKNCTATDVTQDIVNAL